MILQKMESCEIIRTTLFSFVGNLVCDGSHLVQERHSCYNPPMDYIVFDLEWNQCPYGKEREVTALPFEIIEIGAVKLNKDREIVDKYHRIVRPQVYPKLHFRTREIVGKTEEELQKGVPFTEAVSEFLTWAGQDSMFATWGVVDLIELQRNMKFYKLLHLLKGPIHFYDVQKLFAIAYEDMKSRRALEYGIDLLELEKNMEFHQALSDAWYTAEIFQQIDWDIVYAYDSIDVYQNPKTKEEEIHAVYNGYSKFISREFSTKEDALADKEVNSSYCCLCGRPMKKKIRWFSVGAKNYYCMAYCTEHGYMKGKIRMKKNDEGSFFVVKTIKVSSDAESELIRRRKEQQTLKRRIKMRKARR